MEPRAKMPTVYKASQIHLHDASYRSLSQPLCKALHCFDNWTKNSVQDCCDDLQGLTSLTTTVFTWTHQRLLAYSFSAVCKQCLINSFIDKNCNICLRFLCSSPTNLEYSTYHNQKCIITPPILLPVERTLVQHLVVIKMATKRLCLYRRYYRWWIMAPLTNNIDIDNCLT